MTSALQFDEEAARRLEAMYVTPDVVAQRSEVLRALKLRPGERVLDVGSGPGLLAGEMARAVGPAGSVAGIDISESMLALARRRCSNPELAGRVTFGRADATTLPFADEVFDVAVSTQVYEYVADVPRALAELYRVLKPGGRAVILDTDWDSIVWNASDRHRQERILSAWEEHVPDSYLPRRLSAELRDAGFRVTGREALVIFNPEYDVNTYSYGLSRLVADFVAGRRGVTREEAEAWLEDLRRLGDERRYFFSLNRYLFLALKPCTDTT